MANLMDNLTAATANRVARPIAALLEIPIVRDVNALLTSYGIEKNQTGIAFVAMAHALAAIDPTVVATGTRNRDTR